MANAVILNMGNRRVWGYRMSTSDDIRVERSICRMCHGGCGVLVTLREGRVVSVAGDPDHPQTHGYLCNKGRAAADLANHHQRLTQPMHRTGPRGSGRFAPIDWDEAMGLMVQHLERKSAEGRPESVVFCQGTDRNYQEWLFRFANAYGSPNVLGPAHICFYPRLLASLFTCGDMTFVDYEGQPKCVVLWGSNKTETNADGVIGTGLLQAIKRGTDLIVIDPRRTPLTQKARYWLRPRPGSDTALALGMIQVILTHDAYDHEFVEHHTEGFAALAAYVNAYTPEYVETLTWVPAALIRDCALYYARAGVAGIEIGTGVEQNRHAFQAARAIKMLSGLCGNIDRRGGDVIWEPSGLIGRRQLPGNELLPPEQSEKRLGNQEHRLLNLVGWAHPAAVWTAILDHQPYPVTSLFVFGSNLLTTYADSGRIYQALQALDFLVVADLFPTPTAQMADLVLPIASWMERDQIVEFNASVSARRKLCQVGECRSDEEVLTALAHALGLEKHFWPTVRASLDARLQPMGSDWSELCQDGTRVLPPRYEKYREHGFRTHSTKFMFTNLGLERFGYPALPDYSPNEVPAGHYLLTTAHSRYFFNSEFHQLPSLQEMSPHPLLEIHPWAAAAEGLHHGDWARVATNKGAAHFEVFCNDSLDRRVVVASASWWDPGLPWPDSWQQSNLNLLTDESDANPETGSSVLRGIPCIVCPASADVPVSDSSRAESWIN